MTQTHKDPRAVIEQLVGALETCIVVTTGPGESEQLYNFNSVEAAITAGREALERAHGGGSSLFERAKDLRGKAEMPC